MLSFKTLRRANLTRLPLFKNGRGEPAHSDPEGRDWSPSDWVMAVTGELGELANLLKKVKRGDYTPEQAHREVGNELADIQGYLDILAFQLGHDLGEVTSIKFNAVSNRVGAAVFIAGDQVVNVDPRLTRSSSARNPRCSCGQYMGSHHNPACRLVGKVSPSNID